jgi:hypothetical protein
MDDTPIESVDASVYAVPWFHDHVRIGSMFFDGAQPIRGRCHARFGRGRAGPYTADL